MEESRISYRIIGHFVSNKNWIHPSRTIPSYEIIIMLKGKAYIEEEGHKYELEKDDILLLEPYLKHRGYKQSSGRVEFIWLHFRTQRPISFKYLKHHDSYEIKTLAQMLMHKSCLPDCKQENLDALTLLIVNELIRSSNFVDRISNKLVVQICEFVRLNIHKSIEVRDIAKEFGYHENYLGKMFRKVYGIGLKEYINIQKINYIKSLLQTTDMPVKMVGNMCGYDDENLFVKFFKYHEHISPSEYRRQYTLTRMNNE